MESGVFNYYQDLPISVDWLGVLVAEDGVIVTVASVSSPGDIDVVKLISGGDSRSVTEVELDTLILLML